MSAADEWRGILAEDETILWQGRPGQGIRLEFRNAYELPSALFCIGFSVFWMFGASKAGGVFWMFGLLFFFIGLYNLVGKHFWKAYLRRQTHYSLTDKRAFVATNLPFRGRALKFYPIAATTPIELIGDRPGTVYFAQERSKNSDGKSIEVDVGFEQIDEAKSVFGMIRDIQENLAP